MAAGVLASGQIATTIISTVYTVSAGVAATVTSFVLTNETADKISVTVFANTLGTDRRLTKVTIPGGIGKSVAVPHAFGSFSQGDVIKLQADSASAFNYLLTGRTDNV